MIADAAEELTFSASETVEKKLSSRKASKGKGSRISEAVKKAEFYLKQLPDLGSPEKLQQFLEHLKRMGDNSPSALRRESRRFFDDPSHGYAALSYAKDMLEEEGGHHALRASLDATLEQEIEEHGEEIRAGLNITVTAAKYSETGLGETGELRRFYRDNILEYKGLTGLFEQIKLRASGKNFKEITAFMMEALGADLAAQGPSVDPARLKQVLDDLYGIELLKNNELEMERICSTMERIFSRRPALSPEELAKELFSLKEFHWVSPSKVETVVDKCGFGDIEENIFFLREFLETARSLPSKAYGEGEERNRLLDAIQQALDNAIEREE